MDLSDRPRAIVVPAADLGWVGGTRAILLEIDFFGDHTRLDARFLSPDGSVEDDLGPDPVRWTLSGTDDRPLLPGVYGMGGDRFQRDSDARFEAPEAPGAPWTVGFSTPTTERSISIPESERVLVLPAAITVDRLLDAGVWRQAPLTRGERMPTRLPSWVGPEIDGLREAKHAATQSAALPESVAVGRAIERPNHPAVTFLGLDRWSGWFALRYHVATTEAHPNLEPFALYGYWSAASDTGGQHRGRVHHSSGRRGEIAFLGDLAPNTTELAVAFARDDGTILEVVLPLGG